MSALLEQANGEPLYQYEIRKLIMKWAISQAKTNIDEREKCFATLMEQVVKKKSLPYTTFSLQKRAVGDIHQ